MDNTKVLLGNATKAYINSAKIKGRLSPETLRYYQRYLSRFSQMLGMDLEVNKVSITLIENFQENLNQSRLDTKSIALCMIAVRQFFKWLHINNIISLSPELIEIPKAKQKILEIPTEEEVNKLLQACGKSKKGIRDRALIELLLSSGLRVSEVCSLTIDKIDLEFNRTLVIGKRFKERLVLFSPVASEWIERYLRVRKSSDNRLFDISSRQVERIIKNLGQKAGINIHPHLLRHYFCTYLLNKGANINDVSKLAGHSNISTTSRYLHSTDSHLQSVHQNVFGKPTDISRPSAKIP